MSDEEIVFLEHEDEYRSDLVRVSKIKLLIEKASRRPGLFNREMWRWPHAGRHKSKSLGNIQRDFSLFFLVLIVNIFLILLNM